MARSLEAQGRGVTGWQDEPMKILPLSQMCSPSTTQLSQEVARLAEENVKLRQFRFQTQVHEENNKLADQNLLLLQQNVWLQQAHLQQHAALFAQAYYAQDFARPHHGPVQAVKQYVGAKKVGGNRDSTMSASTAAPSSCDSCSDSETDTASVPKTTVTMRNMPRGYGRNELLELLDKHGYTGTYDFVYHPRAFDGSVGFGYAFINFTSESVAERFKSEFNGFEAWSMSGGVAQVDWSHDFQGLQAHIDRYRNSPVMHASVADVLKPAIFDSAGQRVAFPRPTTKLCAPRLRRRRPVSDS